MVAQIAMWVGLVGGIISIITVVASSRVRTFLANRLPSYSVVRYRRRWRMDTVNHAINNAKKEVSVLQTWIPTLNRDIEYWEAAGHHVKKFRVLLASDEIIEARKYCRRVESLTEHNIQSLLEEANREDRTLQIQRYSGIPFGPIYIVDDHVFWGIYLAARDSLRGPMFRSTRDSYLGQLVIDSFEALWNSEKNIRVAGSAKIEYSPRAVESVEVREIVE